MRSCSERREAPECDEAISRFYAKPSPRPPSPTPFAGFRVRRRPRLVKTTVLFLAISALILRAAARDLTGPPFDAETQRAFEQERTAEVVAFYDSAKRIKLYKPDREQVFTSETAFLTYLAARKDPKKLLVVILSKWHEFTDPKQTTDGFWLACKKAGFEHVSIQAARAFGRPILRE